MEHPENSAEYEGLTVNAGVDHQEIVNPYLSSMRKRRQRLFTVDEYVEGILRGDVTRLSQAVTLVESTLPEHQVIAQQVIE
ncbi:MAG: methylmalonyl Co-A mutase-associated GTPase MeaB, partial [Bacteroidaceae bacterium]|nr:methylmalonyl Co-A mutase-associated GTPase MeaB [Bacteroidaceae bacterium]